MNRTTVFHVLILLALGLVVYGVKLGDGGFAYTEGHRVQPAYEMLDGEGAESRWLVPRLFGRPYLRKPPGIQWLIAGSTEVFGRSEFSARAVSAYMMIAGGLLVYGFARRWYGANGGLASGVGFLLMPVLLEGGRSAEIEASHQFFVLLAALPMLDLLLHERARPGFVRAGMVALGVFGMVLTKGPAGLPVLGGVLLASWWVARSFGVYKRAGVWLGLGLGLSVAGLIYWWIWKSAQQFDDVVTQSPGEFLFNADKIGGILLLPVMAFVAGLPCSIAAVFPFGPFAAREAAMSREEAARRRMALGVSWAFVIAVGIYMLSGVSNPRYTWPAVVLLPATVGYVWVGLGEGTFVRLRMVLGRVALLGGKPVWPVVLLGVALAYPWTIEAERRGTSGEAVGKLLAHRIIEVKEAQDPRFGSQLLANDVIEARPEILMYASDTLSGEYMRGGISFAWTHPERFVDWIQRGYFVVVRSDGGSSELEWLEEELGPEMQVYFEVEVHRYRIALVGPAGISVEPGMSGPDR